jgi:DNA-binding transcriptional LysR family regulator
VETRELRYFVAVAEELNFSQAAQRLGMAQPPLSRAIVLLERRLGVTLLQRTSRMVALTEAGAVLLSEAKAILGAISAAERRTRRAAAVRPHLVLVAKTGASDEFLAKLLDAYAAEPDSVDVEVLLCQTRQQQRLLRDGQADVALMHRPYDSTSGFDSEDIFTEGQLVILPRAHDLAARSRLRMDEIDSLPDLPLARWPDANGNYPEGPGIEIHDLTQVLQQISLRRAAVTLPESSRGLLREDLVGVPVIDAPSVTTAIAWPADSRSRAIADLVRTATRV